MKYEKFCILEVGDYVIAQDKRLFNELGVELSSERMVGVVECVNSASSKMLVMVDVRLPNGELESIWKNHLEKVSKDEYETYQVMNA